MRTVFFLAVDGFDLQTGPSTPDVLEAQLNNMTIARREVTVADSKLGRRAISSWPIREFTVYHRPAGACGIHRSQTKVSKLSR
jgi:DeoR/GlpR family transcriptional regulator of sugar metabolism